MLVDLLTLGEKPVMVSESSENDCHLSINHKLIALDRRLGTRYLRHRLVNCQKSTLT